MLIAPTLWRPAQAQTPRALTPAQTEGPFYPTAYPSDSDFDLLVQSDRRYSQGTPVWLDGVVTDIDGKPVRGAVVEIGHNIGGNQVRLEQEVRFDPNKERTRPRLPRWLELVTVSLCWPLMRRYGYHIRTPSDPSAGSSSAASGVPNATRS